MKYPKDLTGYSINEWEILYKVEGTDKWHCRCSCGVERDVSRGNLLSYDSKSCGHDSNKDALIDLQGQRFGMLKVIEYDKDKKKWKCECDCGNITYKRSWDLRNGKGKTCGCKTGGATRRIELEGKKIGQLIVEEYIGNQTYRCLCDCGRECFKDAAKLRNKTCNLSCGCTLNQWKRDDLTNKTFGNIVVLEYKTYTTYKCRCSCGNIFETKRGGLVSGKVIECPQCTQKRLEKQYAEQRIDLTGKRFGSLKVIGYKQNIHKWTVECDCGKIFDVYGQHLRVGDTRSCGCKFGLNAKYRSYLEQEVCEYIRSIYSDTIINNHRGILDNNKEIDIYMPNAKLGIEINGIYWHNEAVKDKFYHINKIKEAYKNGIRLIHIYENEWRDNQLAVMQYLDGIINGKNRQRVYARDTKVIEISTEVAKDFIEKHHLQGYAPASLKLGIQYNNEIISVMTLGKPRFNQSYEWEIVRYCTSSNVNIVGGAEKLFKAFLNMTNAKSVISYCNIDKFDGKVYDRLGFKCIGISDPNYIWMNSHNKIIMSRYETQKYKLIEQGIGSEEQTEDEIMRSLGYMKVYDSGNIIFEFINKEEN